MPATKKTETETATTSDFPAWWDWASDGDGDQIDGTFVRVGRGHTANGERPFVTLEVDGVERTIWLHWEALRSQFSREVARRPDKTIHAGERVIARRLGNRTSANGYEYHDFRVEFPDGPETSQADILGVPATPETPASGGEGEKAEDGIPF